MTTASMIPTTWLRNRPACFFLLFFILFAAGLPSLAITAQGHRHQVTAADRRPPPPKTAPPPLPLPEKDGDSIFFRKNNNHPGTTTQTRHNGGSSSSSPSSSTSSLSPLRSTPRKVFRLLYSAVGIFCAGAATNDNIWKNLEATIDGFLGGASSSIEDHQALLWQVALTVLLTLMAEFISWTCGWEPWVGDLFAQKSSTISQPAIAITKPTAEKADSDYDGKSLYAEKQQQQQQEQNGSAVAPPPAPPVSKPTKKTLRTKPKQAQTQSTTVTRSSSKSSDSPVAGAAPPLHKVVRDNMFRKADISVADRPFQPEHRRPKNTNTSTSIMSSLCFWRRRRRNAILPDEPTPAPAWSDPAQKKKRYVEDYGL